VKTRLMNVSLKTGSLSRPSSSTGMSGKRSMNALVKTPAPAFVGMPESPYTLTRSIPELGLSFLQM